MYQVSCKRNTLYYIFHKNNYIISIVRNSIILALWLWLWETAFSQSHSTARQQGEISFGVLTEIRDFKNIRPQMHGQSRVLKLIWPSTHNDTAKLMATPKLESSWTEPFYVKLLSFISYAFQTNLVPMSKSELQEILHIHSNL